MRNPKEGRTGIPVVEMLSNDQHASEIKHMLDRFINAAATKRKKNSVTPRTVVTDFSWAMIQAVLRAFNSEDCKLYLTRTWKIIMGKLTSRQLKGYTYPQVCAAHMIKDASRKIAGITSDRGKKQFFLQTATSMEDAKSIFHHMCMVLNSRHENEHTHASLKELECLIQRSKVEEEVGDLEDMDNAQCLSESEESDMFDHNKTIRDSSPWHSAFAMVASEVEKVNNAGETGEKENDCTTLLA